MQRDSFWHALCCFQSSDQRLLKEIRTVLFYTTLLCCTDGTLDDNKNCMPEVRASLLAFSLGLLPGEQL